PRPSLPRKRESPAAAGLIFLDSRFHGNDNNGCLLPFYGFINKTNVMNLLPDRIKLQHWEIEESKLTKQSIIIAKYSSHMVL
ncbi:MAG: hypothetical protein MUO68_03570, partial [Desulfobacteraceae bacterium]|nr:hypothetical protein [Desulfobacteraceae bacterium]